MKLFFRIKSKAFQSNDFFFYFWGNRESFCFHLLISNVHNLPTAYFNVEPELLCLTFWTFPTFCNFVIYQHLVPSSFTNNWDPYMSVTRTRLLHFLFLKPAKFHSCPFCSSQSWGASLRWWEARTHSFKFTSARFSVLAVASVLLSWTAPPWAERSCSWNSQGGHTVTSVTVGLLSQGLHSGWPCSYQWPAAALQQAQDTPHSKPPANISLP